MAQTWVYALMGIAIGHLVATVGVYYLLGWETEEREKPESFIDRNGSADSETETGQKAADSSPGREDDLVECAFCETINDPEYRYCRECVSPLEEVIPPRENESGPNSPLVR